MKDAACSLGLTLFTDRPGLSLVIWRDRLESVRGANRWRIHGLYDRSLNRIELFGCDADVSDTDLVRVLAHELVHALGVTGERAARAAAIQATNRLDHATMAGLATAMRAAARTRISGTDSNPRFCSLLGLGE